MRKRAYLYSRGTTWEKTALAYMESFQCAVLTGCCGHGLLFQDLLTEKASDNLPILNTSHLANMTDDTGMLQHAIFTLRIILRAIRPTTMRVL